MKKSIANGLKEIILRQKDYLFDYTILGDHFGPAMEGDIISLVALRNGFLRGLNAKRNLELAEFFNDIIIKMDQDTFEKGDSTIAKLLFWGLRCRAIIEQHRFDEGITSFKKVKDCYLNAISFMYEHVSVDQWNSELIDNLRALSKQEYIKHELQNPS